MEKETRVFRLDSIEIREDESGSPEIRGYAALYGEPSEDLGGFVEVIEQGAFSKAVGRDDVRALFNHDANYVLGRNRADTLELIDDARGLQVVITPPETQWAADLITSMRRGDVDQMSFAFGVFDEEWGSQDDYPLRTLKDIKLYDVSVVTYPAYPQTSAAVRSKLDEISDQAVDMEQEAREKAAKTQARHAARRRRLDLLKRT